ncbi:MAG: nuclear transport factor 2 family protein [Gammaproteobacteria bacterium]
MQELLDSFYTALRKLSTADLAALVTPDFTLNWQGAQAIPSAGEWVGPQGLLEFVKVLNANLQILGVKPLHTLHGPECSVVVLEGHWKVPATGAEVRAKAANVFTFAGGRIASYTVFNNTAAFAEALAGGRSGAESAASRVALARTLSRRAKLGISCRVQVPVGQGLATHPYRVLGPRRSRRKVANKAG